MIPLNHLFTQSYLMSVFPQDIILWPLKALGLKTVLLYYCQPRFSLKPQSPILQLESWYFFDLNQGAKRFLDNNQVSHSSFKRFTDWNIKGLQLYDTRDTTKFTCTGNDRSQCHSANNTKPSIDKRHIPISEMLKSKNCHN